MGEPWDAPHVGHELELMLAGRKPLSMFTSVVGLDEWPDEAVFDQAVADGRLTKAVQSRDLKCRDGSVAEFRRIMYAIPGEEWRLKAMILVHDLYLSLAPGFRPDLDRFIGHLLGYDRDDIEEGVKKALMKPDWLAADYKTAAKSLP
jgi:hypothetical protein